MSYNIGRLAKDIIKKVSTDGSFDTIEHCSSVFDGTVYSSRYSLCINLCIDDRMIVGH